MGRYDVNRVPSIPQMQFEEPMVSVPSDWPREFPKPVIALEREGVIIEDKSPITSFDDVSFIPGSLEALRMLRLKGYKVMIINDQPDISTGKLTTNQVDQTNHQMMQEFGNAGIFSIDGLYYSTSKLKEDVFAKPNVGMFKRAESEIPNIKFKEGWVVGHNIKDLKAAAKLGSVPVLVKTGNGESTIEKLNTYSNKDLSKKVKVFDNLLEFAKSLP